MVWIEAFLGWAQAFVGVWGYLGIFVINIISSASLFLPMPAFVLTFALGAVLNPVLLALAAGAGAALGELTGYGVGWGADRVIERKGTRWWHGWLARAHRWRERWGMFAVILAFAALPLPFDVVGIFSGAINYPLKKFLLANFIGKFIKALYLALAGFYGLGWVLGLFG